MVLLRFMILGVSLVLFSCSRNDTPRNIEPDNTRKNKRDAKGETLLPQNQSEEERGLTQKIRRAIVEDKTLSLNAKNIKIITAEGKVTLRGVVENREEKEKIEALAKSFAGDDQVMNQLEVVHP
jgi:hyperosmotically inducible protein